MDLIATHPDGATTSQVSRLELTHSGAVRPSLRADPSRRTFWTLLDWDDAAARPS